MQPLNWSEFASLALFVSTGLLLTYAARRSPIGRKRIAALLSLATISGAVYFMMASYDGKDSWWSFERPGPFVRRALQERGTFAFIDKEGSAADNGGGDSARQPAAGSSAGNDGATTLAPGAARLASRMPERIGTAAGDVITDCADCPDMIIIEPGFFRIGAVPGDDLADDVERPRAVVMVRRPFAIGRTEITVGQYSAFVRETNHRRPACGFADPVRDARLPLDCIAWRDALAYTQWLSVKSSHPYRLPTEAEWHYAARGGASTRYAMGHEIPTGDANLDFRRPRRVPVATYPANAFGLRDVHGSVAEMVADCWSDTLAQIPGDARRWNRSGDCTRRVLKDAHAGETEAFARLSARRPIATTDQRMGVGFRVMREM